MTARGEERADGTVRPSRFRAVQPWALVWLAVVWVALWGDLSVANVVSGLLLGLLVCLVFSLPPVRMSLRIHPVGLAVLVIRFAVDVVVASAQVARVVLRPRRPLHNSVVEVDLRTTSDFVLTLVAEMTSLVPGSIVVEARRSSYSLFLHVLDTPDPAAAERMREATLALEQRVVRAFLPDPGPGPGSWPATAEGRQT
jgi:multicomponent Na+:H+ antiporter subunit E